MGASFSPSSRRLFLGTLGASLFTTRGLFAEQLAATPWREEGPFYPRDLPLDKDNDLIKLSDSLTPAIGEITHLTGRVLDAGGHPIRNATVEIWQCDANQVYHLVGENGEGTIDKNFQGFGTFTTGSTGEYRFRTIKPVPYPGRPAPHIHFKLKKGDRELLTTQLNIAGHPGNAIDGVANGGLGIYDKELLRVDFLPLKGSKIGELTAKFDIVLDRTPDERALQSHRVDNDLLAARAHRDLHETLTRSR
jgi:protocatechuate 3,4-dioxygenase beta subunit